jgi:hypothetical protein
MESIKEKQLKTFIEFYKQCKALTEANLIALEETVFYVYRTDNNAVLARNIDGFDAAKEMANQLRKKLGLKWDEVKFRKQKTFGVNGRTFTNTNGQSGRVEYSPTVNPSKGRRFSGYYDKEGNYHDLS